MATRGDVRDAVYTELSSVAGTYDVTDSNGNVVDTTTLDADDIGLRQPEQTESLPQVVYHENYRRVEYNGVGQAPDFRTYNDDGSVSAELWREYVEALFIIDVRASSEAAKEPIYEAVRSAFGRYEYGPWPESDLHADIIDVSTRDSNTADTGDVEDVIRGDQVEVRITFHRSYELSTDNIETIESGVEGETFTTT